MSINKFCPNCGTDLSHTSPEAEACLECGHPLKKSKSEKSFITAVLLCLFFGLVGVHRLYVGKTGSGILMIMLLIFSCFLSIFFFPTIFISIIWVVIDLIFILAGRFTDGHHQIIKA